MAGAISSGAYIAIWIFDLHGKAYTFSQVPQQLLAGDTNTVI
jgi:hypothetical protein